jgi:hypothetical protein
VAVKVTVEPTGTSVSDAEAVTVDVLILLTFINIESVTIHPLDDSAVR